ncbi:lipopolysaccharide biosynthesis protein (plasmid) [Phaeobacter sp. G2]|jgi:O-antigen/teichoic acid export membrane protein|nr:lipopolysaccharide biosynthesis protein [Phaeobacter sp. G2]
MKSAAISVALRYLAIAIQFAVVIAVTNTLPLNIAGQYFSVFGVIAVTFTLSGIGIPDGCVKNLSEARVHQDNDRLHALTLSTLPVSMILNLGIGYIIGIGATTFAHLDVEARPIIALWWFGYAGTFLCAQVLVGCGRPVIATFFAYSSVNLAYVPTLLPALVFLDSPDLITIMTVAALAANGAMAISALFAFRISQRLRIEAGNGRSVGIMHELYVSVKSGLPMMLSRFMQASLPWIPVWMLGYFNAVEAAAIYAAASRLTVAVTSVVAALRFSMRGTLVEMNAAGRYREIAALNRKVSLISALPPLAGLIFLLLVGPQVVPLILGADYAPAVPVLIILMFGVFGEALGGISDEILKMTGATRIVLWSLFLAMLCQCTLGLLMAEHGAELLAWGTATAFTLQYVWQTVWLSRKTKITIFPFLTPTREKP